MYTASWLIKYGRILDWIGPHMATGAALLLLYALLWEPSTLLLWCSYFLPVQHALANMACMPPKKKYNLDIHGHFVKADWHTPDLFECSQIFRLPKRCQITSAAFIRIVSAIPLAGQYVAAELSVLTKVTCTSCPYSAENRIANIICDILIYCGSKPRRGFLIETIIMCQLKHVRSVTHLGHPSTLRSTPLRPTNPQKLLQGSPHLE